MYYETYCYIIILIILIIVIFVTLLFFKIHHHTPADTFISINKPAILIFHIVPYTDQNNQVALFYKYEYSEYMRPLYLPKDIDNSMFFSVLSQHEDFINNNDDQTFVCVIESGKAFPLLKANVFISTLNISFDMKEKLLLPSSTNTISFICTMGTLKKLFLHDDDNKICTTTQPFQTILLKQQSNIIYDTEKIIFMTNIRDKSHFVFNQKQNIWINALTMKTPIFILIEDDNDKQYFLDNVEYLI